MRNRPTRFSNRCLYALFFIILLGCSKDSDLLNDALFDGESTAIEDRIKTETPATETSAESEEPDTVNEELENEGSELQTDESNSEFESRLSTFSAVQDAHLQSGKSYNQHIIRLEEDQRTSYLMFDLSPIDSIGATITSAKLLITINSDDGDGTINVNQGGSSQWTENDLDKATPEIASKLGSLTKQFKIGAIEEINLDVSSVQATKETLILEHKDGNDLAFASKEHPSDIGPKLVVTYDAPKGAAAIVIPEISTEEQLSVSEEESETEETESEETEETESEETETEEIESEEAETEETESEETETEETEETETEETESEETEETESEETEETASTEESQEDENEGPMAVADGTPTTGEAPLNVQFKGSNSSDDIAITTYAWDFKDNSGASTANPSHTFNQPGTYEVKLTVTDEAGLTDTDTVTITVTEEPNEAPKAVVTATPSTGTAPLEVQFNGSNSTDDNSISSYAWDFKNGSTATNANPSHTFNQPGTYEVQLTVKDENGLSNSKTVTITVNEPANEAPKAVVTATPSSGVAPLEVQFKGSNSTDDKEVKSYAWNFKDGSSASTANPSHSFANAGSYEVELTVADAEGLSHSKTITINVSAPVQNEAPVANATANPTSGEAPLNVQFTGNNSTDDDAVTSYFWDFKDGSTASSANPSHSFASAGSYPVTLTVKDAEGLSSTKTVTITVNAANNPPPPTNSDVDYYVTTSGKSSNNGRTEATAWSLEHAFNVAKAGDVIYVKAGNYGNKQLRSKYAGSSGNPIKFIGYKNSPGDINSGSGGPTFSKNESVSASKMPLLNGSNGQGTAITLHDRYIHIENFQITAFNFGVQTISAATNAVLKNVIVTRVGNQGSSSSYTGFGFDIEGNNSVLENCFVQNAGAEGIKLFDSDYSRVNRCEVYANNNGNPTDYYVLLTGGTNNTIVENSLADRDQNLSHGGHGFDMKDLATQNTFRNCTSKRTNIELNFGGVKNNTIDNCKIYGVSTSPNQWEASLAIGNGASNNTIKNLLIQDTYAAIKLFDNNDGYVGVGGDRDETDLGHDNTFQNVTVKNTERMLNIGGGTNYSAKARNYTFTNCTVQNFKHVAVTYYPTVNFKFQGCKFSNGQKLVVEYGGQYAPYSKFNVSWSNNTWTNVSFNPPN